MQPTDLEKSIFRTVAYFSLFDYPLTLFEVWKWLAKPTRAYDFGSVASTVTSSLWLADRLDQQDGFVCLKGKSATIATRHERFLDGVRKFKRLKRACDYLGFLPMVKSLAVCNSLAWMNTKAESDIDLFIVTKPKRVWITRLFAVTPFALLGMRPKPAAVDPLCFSFFLSEEELSLQSLKCLKDDWYLAAWIQSLVPLVDRQLFEGISKANAWVYGLFPHSFPVRSPSVRRTRVWSRHADLAKLMEPAARFVQRSRLPAEIRALANQDTRVIVHDQMLKFHPNDRRTEFHQRLEALCSEIS